MRIENVYIILGMLLSFVSLNAQQTTRNDIRIEQVQVDKQGNNVRIDMNINLDNLTMGRADMIILTPILRSADKTNFRRFAPVVLTGSRRSRTLERDIDFNGFSFEEQPRQVERRYNKRPQAIPVTLNVPYENWLRNAELVMQETKSGCDIRIKTEDEFTVYSPVLPPLVEPVYSYSYVTPPVEEVKQRSETHTARLNFEVGRFTILRNFKNNAEILDDVDKVINEIRNDSNLSISDFEVTGYASPEGNEQSNMKLSENRAKAFVSYLRERYNIPPSQVKTNWRGEDWEGLRRAVQQSGITNSSEILTVLDEPNVNQRKTRLRQLNGGTTYRMLLNEYYPPLRRNEYTITFVAKPFSVDEAKAIVRSKPQYLSLNEMFLVANTYPKNSREFKEVFDIAARLYPESPIAQLNTASLELENGSVESAIQRLERINLPEAWNNLGVAYAQRGDYQRAKQYFDRAAQAGERMAVSNAEQLNRFLEAQ